MYNVFTHENLSLVVKEDELKKETEWSADADCAEQDVGCWSQVWSARYMYMFTLTLQLLRYDC